MRSAMRLFREGHPDDFAERHAGLLVAGALTAAAWALLLTSFVRQPTPVEASSPMTIRLQPREEPVLAEQILVEELSFEAAARTSANPDDAADFDPLAQVGGGEPAREVFSIEDWEPTTAVEVAALQRIRSRLLDESDALDAAQTALKSEIIRRSVQSAGREFLLNSDGAEKGVIRLLDVSGFPDDIVRRVCARYGITMTFGYATPSDGGSYLSGARTSSGDYGAAPEPGYYNIFQLSDKAVSMMASLEIQALMAEGCAPGRCRVRQITFGIVMDESGEFRLGVTDLQVERLRR